MPPPLCSILPSSSLFTSLVYSLWRGAPYPDPLAAFGSQGSGREGSLLKKGGGRGNQGPKQETAFPTECDEESEMGGSDLGAVGEGSGEESTSWHGERHPRERRFRVAHRWLEPLRSLETDWKKGGRHIQQLILDIDAHLPNGNLIAL